jgi:hypothetical protein
MHDEHPPARDEMRQVVLQALDVFARLLLEVVHFDDLRDQDVIGLADRLSGDVGRPRETNPTPCPAPRGRCPGPPSSDAQSPRPGPASAVETT